MVYMIERYVMGINIMILSTYVLWTFIPLVGIYNNYVSLMPPLIICFAIIITNQIFDFSFENI
jgi:hypothetical protein